jgi:hypothetical protein
MACDTIVTITIAQDPLLTLTVNESHRPGILSWYTVIGTRAP